MAMAMQLRAAAPCGVGTLGRTRRISMLPSQPSRCSLSPNRRLLRPPTVKPLGCQSPSSLGLYTRLRTATADEAGIGLHVEISNDRDKNATVIEITGHGQKNFLMRVTGVLSVMELQVLSASIKQERDGVSLSDVFLVTDSEGKKVAPVSRRNPTHKSLIPFPVLPHLMTSCQWPTGSLQ